MPIPRSPLGIEVLESRTVPAAFVVYLPEEINISLTRVNGNIVVQAGAATLFDQPMGGVSQLTLDGTAGADQVSIDLRNHASSSPTFRLIFLGRSGEDRLVYRAQAGKSVAKIAAGFGDISTFNTLFQYREVENAAVHSPSFGSQLTLTGTPLADTANVRTGVSATVTFGSGQVASAFGFTTAIVDGKLGRDTATVVDTIKLDQIVVEGSNVRIRQAAIDYKTLGFEKLNVSCLGGDDRVELVDTAGLDKVFLAENWATLHSADGLTETGLGRFRKVHVRSQTGGAIDEIRISDSAANDKLVFAPLGKSQFQNSVGTRVATFEGFEFVATNFSKGFDTATLFDTEGIDMFYGPSQPGSNAATLTNQNRQYLAHVYNADNIVLSGRVGESNYFNVLTKAPAPYRLATANFVPASTLYTGMRRYSEAQALGMLKQLALARDPRLRSAKSDFDLAVLLRDHVHREALVGSNSERWTSLDPYFRYVFAAVLRYERVICGGYSILYYDLLRAFGLPVRIVSLFAANGHNNHASNEVFLGGKWIVMDPTYNISLRTANGQYLGYGEAAAVPFVFEHNGKPPAEPRLVVEKLSFAFRNYLYKIEYPKVQL